MDKTKKRNAVILGIIAVIAGLLLIILPMDTPQVSVKESGQSSEKYRRMLEDNVERIVREVSGVKKCEVMITLKSGYEYYYASNQQTNQTANGNDSKKEYVLAERGNGEYPVIIEERMPVISGVAVVCQNINASSEFKIIQIISALFDIPTNRISVTY